MRLARGRTADVGDQVVETARVRATRRLPAWVGGDHEDRWERRV